MKALFFTILTLALTAQADHSHVQAELVCQKFTLNMTGRNEGPRPSELEVKDYFVNSNEIYFGKKAVLILELPETESTTSAMVNIPHAALKAYSKKAKVKTHEEAFRSISSEIGFDCVYKIAQD